MTIAERLKDALTRRKRKKAAIAKIVEAAHSVKDTEALLAELPAIQRRFPELMRHAWANPTNKVGAVESHAVRAFRAAVAAQSEDPRKAARGKARFYSSMTVVARKWSPMRESLKTALYGVPMLAVASLGGGVPLIDPPNVFEVKGPAYLKDNAQEFKRRAKNIRRQMKAERKQARLDKKTNKRQAKANREKAKRRTELIMRNFHLGESVNKVAPNADGVPVSDLCHLIQNGDYANAREIVVAGAAELEPMREVNRQGEVVRQSYPALKAAFETGDTRFVRLLLNPGSANPNYRADVHTIASDCTNALRWAIDNDLTEYVQDLLDAGLDPDVADVGGVTPRDAAANKGLEAMLDAAASVSTSTPAVA